MAENINSQSKPIFIESDDDTIEDARAPEEIHDKKQARLVEASEMTPQEDGLGPQPASWPPISVKTVLKAEDRVQAERKVTKGRETNLEENFLPTPGETHDEGQARHKARRKAFQERMGVSYIPLPLRGRSTTVKDAATRAQKKKIADEYTRSPEYQALREKARVERHKARLEREEEDRIELENRAKARREEEVDGHDWTRRPLVSSSTLMRKRVQANTKTFTTETPVETEPEDKADACAALDNGMNQEDTLSFPAGKIIISADVAGYTIDLIKDEGALPNIQEVDNITTKPSIIKDPHKIEYLTPAQQAQCEEKWRLNDEAEQKAIEMETERTCGDEWVVLSDYEIGMANRW